jgi:hypothetical protein
MHAIADEEPDADSAAQLHGRILTWEIELARAKNDSTRIIAKLQEALSLLDRLERKGSSPHVLNGFRHNLAHHLTQSGLFDLGAAGAGRDTGGGRPHMATTATPGDVRGRGPRSFLRQFHIVLAV